MSSLLSEMLATSDQKDSAEGVSRLEHVRRKHIGRYVSGAVVLAFVLWIALAFAHGQIEWSVVRQFLTAATILAGLINTVVMAILAMLLGVFIGTVVAIMGFSDNPVVKVAAASYVWLFRGAPALLQLLLWFNLALIFPTIGIPGLFEFRTIDVMTPFVAALVGLGVCQGAYTSEVVRAGLLSVDRGQYEAAKAIGMAPLQALSRIVLPQAMRVILPPIGNEFIGMVKVTSLASVIQFTEILHSAENIYYANNRVIELLIVATVWYLLVVTVLSIVQKQLERYFARGAGHPRQSR